MVASPRLSGSKASYENLELCCGAGDDLRDIERGCVGGQLFIGDVLHLE